MSHVIKVPLKRVEPGHYLTKDGRFVVRRIHKSYVHPEHGFDVPQSWEVLENGKQLVKKQTKDACASFLAWEFYSSVR